MRFSSLFRRFSCFITPFITENSCITDTDGLEICPQFAIVARSRIGAPKLISGVHYTAELPSSVLDHKLTNIRKTFPESWLFDEITLNDKNGLVQKENVSLTHLMRNF